MLPCKLQPFKNLQFNYLNRNKFRAIVESNASFIYIGKGMFKQNIYGNEGKFETSAHPDIINAASSAQTV